MVKTTKEDWQIKFEQLIKKHNAEQREFRNLSRQLFRLMVKHTHLKFNVIGQGTKFEKKMEAMEILRRHLDTLLHNVHLTAQKKEKLLKMQAKLPTYSLMDRIKLMELSTQLPNVKANMESGGRRPKHWYGRDMKRIFGRVSRTKRKLQRLDDEIHAVIADIHDLHSLIKYVQNTKAAKFKITPFMHNKYWIELISLRPRK